MKYLKYIVILLVIFTAGTTLGAVAKKTIDVLQNDNFALIYAGETKVILYKVDDGKNTCYVGIQEKSRGSGNLYSQTLSCVKN